MPTSYNGIPAPELLGADWQRSSLCGVQGDCVELAQLDDGQIAVRNSTFPSGPALVYTQDEINALILGVKAGDFDHFLRQRQPQD